MTFSVTIKNQSSKQNHNRCEIGLQIYPPYPQSGKMSEELWLTVKTGGHREGAATELTFN